MANLYYDNAADLSLIQAKKVGDHRLRLAGTRACSESCATAACRCASGLQPGSGSLAKAQKEGLTVGTPAEVAAVGRRDHDPDARHEAAEALQGFDRAASAPRARR